MKETNLKKVSIRLVSDIPLLSKERMDSPEAAIRVAGKYLSEMDRELLAVINLNSKLQPINFNVVSIGTVNQSLAVPREILKSAVLSNATHMIMMHNHPSGELTPSKDDVIVTSKLIAATELLGISLVDHIIVGPNKKDYFSMSKKESVDFHPGTTYESKLEYLKFKFDKEMKVAEQEIGKAR